MGLGKVGRGGRVVVTERCASGDVKGAAVGVERFAGDVEGFYGREGHLLVVFRVGVAGDELGTAGEEGFLFWR